MIQYIICMLFTQWMYIECVVECALNVWLNVHWMWYGNIHWMWYGNIRWMWYGNIHWMWYGNIHVFIMLQLNNIEHLSHMIVSLNTIEEMKNVSELKKFHLKNWILGLKMILSVKWSQCIYFLEGFSSRNVLESFSRRIFDVNRYLQLENQNLIESKFDFSNNF